MKALIQRCQWAKVEVNQQVIGEVDKGILALIGIEPNDNEAIAERLLQRIIGYRIFSDDNDRMNLSLTAIDGGLLLVPQFTLAADTKSGMRPSFSTAAEPEKGNDLFNYLQSHAKKKHLNVSFGKFGADMQVSLCNDGPVTFLLEVN